MGDDGGDICALALADDGDLVEIMYPCADAAVQPDAGHIDAVSVIDFDNIQRGDVAVNQSIDVHEFILLVTELLDEVVACTAGENGQRHIGQTYAGSGALIDRAVTAAGIHPQVGLVLCVLCDFCGTVSGTLSDVDFVLCLSALKGLLDERGGKGGSVALTGSGVDNKQMLHFAFPLSGFFICK